MRNSEAPGWCREASYRASWQVGGPSAALEGLQQRAERRFRRTRTDLREYPQAFATALTRFDVVHEPEPQGVW